MAKQSAADRYKRLNEGRCPIHGIGMEQVDGFSERFGGKLDGESVAICECPRRDCKIQTYAAGPDGPFEIKEEWAHVMAGEKGSSE